MIAVSKPVINAHDCPAPGCGKQVPRHRLACATHWWQLPKPLRNRITDHYRRNRLEHAKAIREACDWFEANAKDEEAT